MEGQIEEDQRQHGEMVKLESRRVGFGGEDTQDRTKWKLGVTSWWESHKRGKR